MCSVDTITLPKSIKSQIKFQNKFGVLSLCTHLLIIDDMTHQVDMGKISEGHMLH